MRALLGISLLIVNYAYHSSIISNRGHINPSIRLWGTTSDVFEEETSDDFDAGQFEEWEREEIELQRLELEKRAKSDFEETGEGDGIGLPDYMLRMLDDFGGEFFDEDAPPVPSQSLPVIAVIGRPNTGKSTIVNRLTNSFKDGAIVHDEPGITRDATYRVGEWDGYKFQVVDTGGIIFDDTEDIFAEKITYQALTALETASAAILVVDGQVGPTAMDEELATWLRKNNNVPLYLAVNKCESQKLGATQAAEFWSTGLGEPYPVSGIHGTGLGDLMDHITNNNLFKITNVAKENATNIAFIGRPNVGKSSLFNKLLGQDRAIVSDKAGTTRDSIDALMSYDDKQYRIVDTAGIRKKGKISYGAEFFMINRAFKAIRRAEVVVLLLSAVDGIVDQDRMLAERIYDEGRSCVIALNKWDIVDNKDDKTYLKAVENVRLSLPRLRWAEICLISAKTGQRTEKLFSLVDRAAKQFSRRIPTAVLNEVIQDAVLWMAPPRVGAKTGRVYYCIQISVAPPTIVIFVNNPNLFTESYQRYLERKIRDNLDFEGTPLKLIFRGKSLRDVGRAASKGYDKNTRGR
jgi:GTPase